jgi:hypothetical protein
MKILVAISTRSRPLWLAGTLFSLQTLASGKHEIQYIVRADNDDPPTNDLSLALAKQFHAEIFTGDPPISLGAGWNRIAKMARDWDACCVIADKHLCMTPNWDDGVREVIEENGMPAARWSLKDKDLETVLILSRTWYEATGQVFPEWFPFWFSERWVAEIHHLAFGVGIPRITNMHVAEPVGPTQGLRDLEFWFDFFARTRILRIQEARKVAKAFNRILPPAEPIIAEMRRADEWQIPRIAGYYETRGKPAGDPSEQYKIAKTRAEEWLREHTELIHA